MGPNLPTFNLNGTEFSVCGTHDYSFSLADDRCFLPGQQSSKLFYLCSLKNYLGLVTEGGELFINKRTVCLQSQKFLKAQLLFTLM